MTTNSTQPITGQKSKRNYPITDLRQIISKYLFHWPLFFLGVIIAVACAFIYIQITGPVYRINASLVIRDDKKIPDQDAALHEIDMVNSSKIVENETEILGSQKLISQVVDDLKLWINYQEKDGLLYKDIYNSGPVKFTLIKPADSLFDNDSASDLGKITIAIKDNKSFFIEMPGGVLKEFLYRNIYENHFGTWKLEPTGSIARYKDARIKITIHDPKKVALKYKNLIEVNMPDKLASTVTLSLKDHIPQRGMDILNDLILNYNVASVAERNRETKNTLDFIDQRLASLSGELTSSEKGIEKFKSSRGLTDISSASKIDLQNLQDNEARLNNVNIQLSVLDGIETYTNSSKNSEKFPTVQGINDPVLTNLIEKLSDLQLEREQLLATTPETNPSFESINSRIASTKATIKDNVKSLKTSLLQTRDKLQSYDAHFQSSVKDIPTQEREYISIKRQEDIKENLYTYLLQQREKISVNYASTLTDDRIVDEAYAERIKISTIALPLSAALLLGMAFPAFLIYRRTRNKVTDLDDIKESVEIPVIAELMFEPSNNPVVISETHTNAISEQIRALRNKLHHLHNGQESGKVTLITSSVSGEGKSFITCNLGAALAYSGKKTIILEMDLRKPQFAAKFNLSRKHAGVSDFLTQKASLHDIIQNSGITPDLDVIISGSDVQNPSELLEREQLDNLILSLRGKYDEIIIDSPPVHLVSDALTLSRITDCTFYIVRQGVTQMDELDFIGELHSQKQLPNMNIVFNGIRRVKFGYGYNYDKGYYNPKKSGGTYSIFSNFLERF